MRQSPADLPGVLSIPVVRVPSSGAAFEVAVTPPGSKSLTNRALLLGGLARGTSVIRGALRDGDDAVQMMGALRKLGAGVVERADGSVEVAGVGGRWRVGTQGVTLNVNGAGTAARFLAGASLLADGPVTIDGNARLRERPMGELGGVLERFGARVEYFGRTGSVPMRVVPPGKVLAIGEALDIPTASSSQFVSALLLMAPWLGAPLTVRLIGEVTSASYVSMTLGLLGRLGASVQYSDNMRVIRVGGPRGDDGVVRVGGLSAFEYEVEPDASGATAFWGAAAIVPGSLVRVAGLADDSLQGDADFPLLLERMGARVHRSTVGRVGEAGAERFIEVRGMPVLRPIFADMSDMPDAIMTLAVVASFASGASIIRGVRTLRHKESDRVSALVSELGKVGVRVVSPVSGDEDVMTVTPPAGGIAAGGDPVEFETYEDHRLAMSLALVGLRRGGVSIRGPRCVEKTYPSFWQHFGALYE